MSKPLADHILEWDKRQAGWNPDARTCPTPPKPKQDPHGKLSVHASGHVLICPIKGCNYQEPIPLG